MGIDNSPLNHVQRPNTFHVSAPNHGANFSIHGPSSLSHPNSLLWATSSKLWIFWRFKSPRWQSNVPNIAQFTAASGWSSHLAYESRNHHSPSQAAAPFGSAKVLISKQPAPFMTITANVLYEDHLALLQDLDASHGLFSESHGYTDPPCSSSHISYEWCFTPWLKRHRYVCF